MGHYVFMHFAPSFLRSPAVRVTRIPESKRRRLLYVRIILIILVRFYERKIVQCEAVMGLSVQLYARTETERATTPY